MTHFNRREFLSLAALTAGNTLLSERAWSQPATSATGFPQLLDLPNSSSEPGLVSAELIARPAIVQVGGKSAKLLTYNGSSPGPVLRVREGDTVRLKFTNRLSEMTNLHLHGLHISPNVDNPLRMLEPNASMNMEFTVPKGSSGTYWYHPHAHGMVSRQLFGGMAGAIIVEGEADAIPELREAHEQLIVLRDLGLVNGSPSPHTTMDWLNGKEGAILTVNGAIKPTLLASKSTLRLRLVNASNARTYRLKLEGHPLHLIATDGGMLEKPVTLEELLLAPGERAEVLVQLKREGTFKLLDLPYSRGKMSAAGAANTRDGDRWKDSGGMNMGGTGGTGDTRDNFRRDASDTASASGTGNKTPVTVMFVNAPKLPKPAPLPTHLTNLPVLANLHPALTRRVVFTERPKQAKFLINGKSFDPNRVDFTGKVGTLEVWEIKNWADMDHPFHLHTYRFQVLSRNGKPEPYRAWKDVVNLRRNETVRIAVPLADFSGKTVFHCHVAEHEDKGMMGVFEVRA